MNARHAIRGINCCLNHRLELGGDRDRFTAPRVECRHHRPALIFLLIHEIRSQVAVMRSK